jgi:photosystem II stability/assembly factor-like uncharacterized protein
MKKITNLKKIVLSISMALMISGTLSFVNGQTPVTPPSHSECEYFIGTLTFSVRILKGSTYQWYTAPPKSKLFTLIPGATSNILTYTFSKLQPLIREYNGQQFKCKITPLLGLSYYSETAYLYVLYRPSISAHPSSVTKYVGESVTFSVTASGSTPKYYQWQLNTGGGYSDIMGATSTSYTISSVVPGDAGDYRCTVTNDCGSATSNPATLTVVELIWPEGWFSQKENTNPVNSKYMYDVHAIDSNKAWIVVTEYWDSLIYTNNGGETWHWTHTGVTNKTYWRSVFFTDSNHGWVAGYKTIAYTTNGGASWLQWYDAGTNYFEDLYFINSSTGWAVGYNGTIYKTTDGGLSWNPQSSGQTANFTQVHFADASNGIVVGQGGTIVYTNDGGNNWLIPTTNPAEVTLNAVYMTHPDTAFIAGSYQSGDGYMHMKTTDGGAKWTQISGPYNYGYDLQFVNSKEGWMTAGSGKIYYTNNGGLNWYEQATETSQTLYAISMVDTENGWAVGYAGAMQRTAFSGCYLPRVNLYADTTTCATSNYLLRGNTYSVLYQTYLWSTGETTENIYATPPGGKYWVDVWNMCKDRTSDSIKVEYYPLPVVDAGEDVGICPGDTIQLNASGGEGFSWTPGGTLSDPNIQNPRAFPNTTTTYNVNVTDTNGCVGIDPVTVTVHYPFESEEICLVSVDIETDKNMVIWEKTPNERIAGYKVYRESKVKGVYDTLSYIPYDSLSVFVDMTSQPRKEAHLYKIGVVDSCGNVSSWSAYHKTLFLQYGGVVEGEGVIMNWGEYEIEDGEIDFVSYIIYRGSDSTQLQPIDTISASKNQYTDIDPEALAGRRYYRIAGVKSAICNPANLKGKKAGTGPYSQSMSNIEDNRLQVGISDIRDGMNNLKIYPNPFRQQTRITYSLDKSSDVKIEIYNLLGARTADIVNLKQEPGEFSYDLSASDIGVAEGVFYLRFTVNGNTTVKKLILTK